MTIEKRKELDTIDIRIPRHDCDFGYIRVNGRSFEDLVDASGGKPVARVPYRFVAGGKGALLDHFVGRGFDGESCDLFICSCGDSGCWGLAVVVHRTRRFVYWRYHGRPWFRFGRKLYEAAFAKAQP